MKKRSADALSQYLYLMDEGFETGRWHSLIGNLREVRDADWEWVPPGGSRSIRAIVEHVGECKIMRARDEGSQAPPRRHLRGARAGMRYIK